MSPNKSGEWRDPSASPHNRHGARPDKTLHVSLGACGWRIAFTNCADVLEGVKAILHGWDIQDLPRSVKLKPHAHIARTSAGTYRWRSDAMPRPALWDRDPPASAMNVIRDVHDVIFDWFLNEHPAHLCLHAAAVRIGSGLICFPSIHKAGKSTLCTALAASGQKVYCDDVLPIEPERNYGMAMGMAPLLRRPLPAHLGTASINFVAARKGPANKGWVYVRLGLYEIAPFGEQAPIKAFVLLHRKNGGRPKLEPVIKSQMLKELILQNFAEQVPPVQILDRLMSITEAAQCCQLQFDHIGDAAKLLVNTFAGGARTSRRSR